MDTPTTNQPPTEPSAVAGPNCAPVSGSEGSIYEGEKCESGCASPVVAHDSEGIPLCAECYEDLASEPLCERCGGEGRIDYLDGDGSDWGEDCPSEENHPIVCRACRGSGVAQ